MRVTIIGCGYVGLTTSAALAYIGHRVNCIDQNRDLIEVLQNGDVPLHEVGIKELLAEVCDRLTFGGWDSFDVGTDIVIIAVGTPRKDNGDADMTYVEAVAGELGRLLPGGRLPIIVNKSTVPIGYAQRVKSIISCRLRERGILTPVTVVSNPEFLREGRALFDSFYPDRIIIGADDSDVADVLCELYMPIIKQTFNPLPYIKKPEDYSPPKPFITTPTNAELIKYASNAFLAVKISFINEIAGLTERVGANIKEIAGGIGLDRRIGAHYLNAGIGWGGSCFGKDVQAMLHTARQYGYEMPLSSAAVQVNANQREEVVRKLQAVLKVLRGTTIGLLGLSFKPGTDDLRDAPSIAIANRLIELGAHVKVYDPVSMDNCRKIYPEMELKYAAGVEELASDADALVLFTEWDEFTRLPFSQLGSLMKNKIIIDGRNVLNAQELIDSGFKYIGIGR